MDLNAEFLTQKCNRLIAELEETLDLLSKIKPTTVPAVASSITPSAVRYRATFTWATLGIKSSVDLVWVNGRYGYPVYASPVSVKTTPNIWGTMTIQWTDGVNEFTGNVDPNFVTPSLWRGIRVRCPGKPPRKSYTYTVEVVEAKPTV